MFDIVMGVVLSLYLSIWFISVYQLYSWGVRKRDGVIGFKDAVMLFIIVFFLGIFWPLGYAIALFVGDKDGDKV